MLIFLLQAVNSTPSNLVSPAALTVFRSLQQILAESCRCFEKDRGSLLNCMSPCCVRVYPRLNLSRALTRWILLCPACGRSKSTLAALFYLEETTVAATRILVVFWSAFPHVEPIDVSRFPKAVFLSTGWKVLMLRFVFVVRQLNIHWARNGELTD